MSTFRDSFALASLPPRLARNEPGKVLITLPSPSVDRD